MAKVKIRQEFARDYISREAGERLREIILVNTAQGESVEIDFIGIKVGSTTFFDEAFAKLVDEGWGQLKFRKWVKLTNLNPLDRKVLDQVVRYRGLN